MIITIKGRFYKEKTFPSLNDYINELGRSPYAGSEMKKKYMNIAISACRRDLKAWRTNKPVILKYTFFEPKKGRRRDVMNVFALADKFVEDALVKLKVLPDDNPQYVINTEHEFYYTDDTPYFTVEIKEQERFTNENK